MKIVVTRWWILVVFALVASCKRAPSPTTPEGAYRAFIDALNRGQAQQAWGLLSNETQEKAQARSRRIAETSKGLIRDEPAALLFQAANRPPPGQSLTIKPGKTEANEALLEVSAGGSSHQVKLVKRADKWFIDLTERL